MQRRAAARLAPLLLGAVCALWVALLAVPHLEGRASLLDPLESRLLDLRYRIVGPRPAAPQIILVAIDDATLEADEAWPVGRARLAQLVDRIAESGARTLVVDVLLADAGQEAERAALAAALARMPTVIAGAARLDDDGGMTVIWPHPDFAAQAEVGLVNLSVDAGGIPRYVPLFIEAEERLLPSLPLLAAVSLTGEQARITDRGLILGDRTIPLDAAGNMPLRLLGPAGTVTTVSALGLLDGSTAEAFSGKVVILGYSAAAMGDRFVTPFDGVTPGAEIIATAISQLVGGQTLRRDAGLRRWDIVHASGLVAICFFLTLYLPLLQALPVVLALLTASFAALTGLFAAGLWLSAALPLAAALPPLALAGAWSLMRDRQKARRSDQSLASLRRFQSPVLARRIENDPDYLRTPVARDLVILFVDLTGFTALSQQLGADGTRALLQRFHGLTTEAVEAHDGIVINYMGDGALAVFGLEDGGGDRTDADRALAAAGALERRLANVTLPFVPRGLTCRIGLHRGPVMLSRLGADNHQQVSVSGDTVNLASRLLELAKAESARVVATRDFTDHLSVEDALRGTREANLAVRGRRGHVAAVIWPINRAAGVEAE